MTTWRVTTKCGSKAAGKNHRLFCVLERDAKDLGGSSIVCLGGLSKPPRTAASPRDYRQIKRCGAEFQKWRTIKTCHKTPTGRWTPRRGADCPISSARSVSAFR
jgi:hypothetical protein